MHIENFEIALKKAENWHKKNLTAEQAETYYEHLNFIPDVAIYDIVNGHIKETKPIPGAFPTINDLLQGWYKWKQDNPAMIEERKKKDCTECFGSGWLWFRPPVEEGCFPYEYIIGCKFCKNWQVDVGASRRIPLSTRAELEAKNCVVYPYDYRLRKRYKTVEEMTKEIGNIDDDAPF